MKWCLLFSGLWAASGAAEAVLAHLHCLLPCLPAPDVFLARTAGQEHVRDEGISWEVLWRP